MKVGSRTEPARAEYFDSVRRLLLDIPWAQRQQLLGDLASRIDELPPRTNPGAVLGPGDKYARLMREAAGYGPTAPRRFAYIRAWRLRRKVVVALAIVAVAALAIAIPIGAHANAVRRQYQPLTADEDSSTSTAPSVEPNVPTDASYWQYRRRALVVIGAVLANTGHTTATVTGFVVPTSPYGPIVPTELRVAANPVRDTFWQHAKPFEQLAVHPGQRFTIYVVMKIVPWRLDGFVAQPLPTLTVDVGKVAHLLPIEGERIGIRGPGEPNS